MSGTTEDGPIVRSSVAVPFLDLSRQHAAIEYI